MQTASLNKHEIDLLKGSEYVDRIERQARLVGIGSAIGAIGALALFISGLATVIQDGFMAGAPWVGVALIVPSWMFVQYDSIRFRARALGLIRKLKVDSNPIE